MADPKLINEQWLETQPPFRGQPAEVKTEPKPSRVDKYKDSYFEGQEIKAFQQGLGMEEKREEKKEGNTELVQILTATMTAQSNAINTLLQSAIAQRKPGGEESTALNFLINFLTEENRNLKKKQDELRDGSNVDPVQLIADTAKRWKDIEQTVGQRIAVPDSTNMNAMIEIEKIKGEREDRHDQNQLILEDKKYEREQAARQWQADHELKIAEFNFKVADKKEEREQRAKVATGIQDMAESVIEAIDFEGAPPSGAISKRVAGKALPAAPPIKFTCREEGCGQKVTVSADAEEFDCPKCGLHHIIEEVPPGEVPSPEVPA